MNALYPNEPGARTLREARPMYVNGERVSAVQSGDHYTVFVGGGIIAEGRISKIPGRVPLMIHAQALALVLR